MEPARGALRTGQALPPGPTKRHHACCAAHLADFLQARETSQGGLDQPYLAEPEINVLAAEVARAAGGSGGSSGGAFGTTSGSSIGSPGGPSAACVCIPGVFKALRSCHPGCAAHLLDFNPFYAEAFGGAFTPYECRRPDQLPAELRHRFAAVIAATPFATEECVRGVARTMLALGRLGGGLSRFFLLTEAPVPAEVLESLGLRAAALRPRRRAGSTALYTNFAPSHYLSDWELVH